MSGKANNYIVLSKSSTEKRPGESWREVLDRWVVRCPQCREQWLVVGARENDLYVCRDCGHGFAIRLSVASKSASDDVKSDAA